eukprot:CAMPEP_0176406626 /NCGR_PEP_ID=MMETSP0127-20121128/976_1 /TAXON_ID=938130 /ORGANISM="Platyophrya macrostoma, Strain WH" /LENGTH=127 /DNA_ID=CAMNT_0017785773 /DNA_START=32 /DNA_END=415 /DNA_ORIENTATION=-
MADNKTNPETTTPTPTTEETIPFTQQLRDGWDEVHGMMKGVYYDLSKANLHQTVTDFKKDHVFQYPQFYRECTAGFIGISTLFLSFKYRGGIFRPFRNAAVAYGVSAFFIYPEGINPYYTKYYTHKK